MVDKPLSSGDVVKVVTFVLLFLPTIVFAVGVIPALFLIVGFFLMRKNSEFAYLSSAISAARLYLILVFLVCCGVALLYSYPFTFGYGRDFEKALTRYDELQTEAERKLDLVNRYRFSNADEAAKYLETGREREERILALEQVEVLEAKLENSLAGRLGVDHRTYDNLWYEEEVILFSILFAVTCIAYLVAIQWLFAAPLIRHRNWVAVNGVFSNKAREAFSPPGTEGVRIVKGEQMRTYSVAEELTKWAALREAGHISEDEFQSARAKLLRKR